MTEIEQAMASLKHLVECRCDEAYTGRGRHDPYSACDYAEDVKIVADHVAFIEAKLAKAVEALGRLVALNDDYSPFGGEMFQDRVERTWQKARTTLAEIKSSEAAPPYGLEGESHDAR